MLGQGLDSVILEGSSNLDDSVTTHTATVPTGGCLEGEQELQDLHL